MQSNSNEWRVLAAVAIALIGTECSLSYSEKKLSLDVAHLANMALIAENLHSATNDGHKRILFVGNSLVREGIDVKAFAESAEEQLNQPCSVERLHPDNSALAEWYYAIDRFVLNPKRKVDVIVIGFQGGHLRDAPSRHVEKLRRYYCGVGQLSSLWKYDLLSFESWFNFLINGSSAALSNRDRVERKVLNKLIPNYQAGIQKLNRNQQLDLPEHPAISYVRLGELVEKIRSQGVAVILAEIPIPDPQPIDPELFELADNLSIPIIESNRLTKLTEDYFPDGLHMNGSAAKIYSQHLGRVIDWRRLDQESSERGSERETLGSNRVQAFSDKP